MNQQPDVKDGIEYWKTQPASLDGVLGGYGTGALPRIDSLGSRLFLLQLNPYLSSILPLQTKSRPQGYRTRALDVGAGIGRVTSDVLLHLISDVTLLEPVPSFIQQALALSTSHTGDTKPWNGIADSTRSVTFLNGTLQSFDPLNPHRTKFLDRVGYQPPRPQDDIRVGFDVIWCQWCLGHMGDSDLVEFFVKCKLAFRDDQSVIVVKENLCGDLLGTVFDEEDSSVTRSDRAWKAIFAQAGLKVIRQQIQEGLPSELLKVKMYGLRAATT